MVSIRENGCPCAARPTSRTRRDRRRTDRPRAPRRRSTTALRARPRAGPAPSRRSRRTARRRQDRELVRLGLGGHEADAAEDRRGRVLDVLELGQRHERLRLHRPADEDRVVRAREARRAPAPRRRGHVRRPAEHEPHRAVLVVMGDQDDRLAEVRVDERGRRDEQLSLKRVHWSN